EGDFLDVLGGGGQEALVGDACQTSEPCIAVSVKLFGVGKGALDRLLAALVDRLAPRRQPMPIGALACVGPDMAGDRTGCGSVGGAGSKQWAIAADLWIRTIVAIAVAICGGIGKQLALRADIAVLRAVIGKL